MATRKELFTRAAAYGRAANNITLDNFTEPSVTTFLNFVADTVDDEVISPGKISASPWTPSFSAELRGSVCTPGFKDGQPEQFSLLTNPRNTRAIVGADPANLADTTEMMRAAAKDTTSPFRLPLLRIALRWNTAMNLALVDQLELDETSEPFAIPPENVPLHGSDALASWRGTVDNTWSHTKTGAAPHAGADDAATSETAADTTEAIPVVTDLTDLPVR